MINNINTFLGDKNALISLSHLKIGSSRTTHTWDDAGIQAVSRTWAPHGRPPKNLCTRVRRLME